jgi:HK97 family phage major capsid protein
MFNAYTGSSDIVLVPVQLMQDSYFDLNKQLAWLLGERLGRLLSAALTTGSGNGQPTGIVTAAVASGLNYQMPTGNSNQITDSNSLIQLEHTVDVAYRKGAKFMFHDQTLKSIKMLKDNYGRYLWLPGLAANDPNTINGYEYVINNGLATMAPSAYCGLFGQLKKYKVRRVAGETTVLRLVERYADYLQQGFIGFVRVDGNLLDAGTHPIATLQNSAT